MIEGGEVVMRPAAGRLRLEDLGAREVYVRQITSLWEEKGRLLMTGRCVVLIDTWIELRCSKRKLDEVKGKTIEVR